MAATDSVGHVGVAGVAAHVEQGRDHHAARGDDRLLPFGFGGDAAVGALDAAHQRHARDRIELVAHDFPRVDVEAQLAAGDRFVRRIGIVERRQHPGLLVVARRGAGVEQVFLDLEVHCAKVEIVAAAEAGQVDLRTVHHVGEAADPIGVREILVGLPQQVPAERPARIDLEQALAADHAAQVIGVARSAAIDAAQAELPPDPAD